jgi:hypothetical protein
MKVRANNWYTYRPALIDTWDPCTTLRPGERVQVRKAPGCPPPNTMGHAHVYDVAGKLRGLVHTASLTR